MDAPSDNEVKSGKIFKSYIFTLLSPQGACDVSEV